MDEPTASLTQTETDYLLTVVRKLSYSGVAVVFVSHRLAEVLAISSRVTVLRDGHLVGVYATRGVTFRLILGGLLRPILPETSRPISLSSRF